MNKEKEYNYQFYEKRHSDTIHAAEVVLGLVADVTPPTHSAVDLGCGVGTWLAVLKKNKVEKVKGFDGAWVNKSLLQIPEENFFEQDFTQPIPGNETFDLAISLEVAEHLPAKNAKDFVLSLTLLSDFVLFSAAIPYQGGVGHLNEQWPNYWISLFKEHGFECLDFIRKQIWDDPKIPYWYKQNTFLFVKNNRLSDIKLVDPLKNHVPPEIYLLSFNKAVIDPGVKLSARNLMTAISRRLKRVLNKFLHYIRAS